MLQQELAKAMRSLQVKEELIKQYWTEILKAYSEKHRYYHTLTHLENLYTELLIVKDQVNDWDVILFSIAYHDIIYKPSKNNNEEKSALLAKERLQNISATTGMIHKCVEQIKATKGHSRSADDDTNYFTDADLSILGKESSIYQSYAAAIRKEYKLYPDFLYNPGRIKVLEYFLNLPAIYKTKDFAERYETNARANLSKELNELK